MELTINVEDYISESDIKEMCKQSVRSYIDKQISQFTNIKDFISEAVYGSISGEFLKVIFQENPEAVEEALRQLKKLVKDGEFISSYSLFGYSIEPDASDRYYRPATYARATYINTLVQNMLKENEEAIRDKIKEIAFSRVEASTLKGINDGDFDLSYYILDALRKGLRKED
nr:MAG TPA: hypothetical protein [Caudoviricetes sp.]